MRLFLREPEVSWAAVIPLCPSPRLLLLPSTSICWEWNHRANRRSLHLFCTFGHFHIQMSQLMDRTNSVWTQKCDTELLPHGPGHPQWHTARSLEHCPQSCGTGKQEQGKRWGKNQQKQQVAKSHQISWTAWKWYSYCSQRMNYPREGCLKSSITLNENFKKYIWLEFWWFYFFLLAAVLPRPDMGM